MNHIYTVVSTSQSEMEAAQTGSHSSQTQESDVRQDSQVVGMCKIRIYVLTT